MPRISLRLGALLGLSLLGATAPASAGTIRIEYAITATFDCCPAGSDGPGTGTATLRLPALGPTTLVAGVGVLEALTVYGANQGFRLLSPWSGFLSTLYPPPRYPFVLPGKTARIATGPALSNLRTKVLYSPAGAIFAAVSGPYLRSLGFYFNPSDETSNGYPYGDSQLVTFGTEVSRTFVPEPSPLPLLGLGSLACAAWAGSRALRGRARV